MILHVEKIFGYILLGLGLVCILFAFLSMYNVFTDVSSPPEIFKMQSLSLTTTPSGSSEPGVISISLDPQARKIVDMFLYYLLMIFVVIIGGKLSSLGIQLIKELKTKVKNN